MIIELGVMNNSKALSLVAMEQLEKVHLSLKLILIEKQGVYKNITCFFDILNLCFCLPTRRHIYE